MTVHYAMKAAKREQAGKGAARSLRRAGRIPAVIYGDKKEPVKISLEANTINVEYRKGHMYTSLCDMDIDGQKHLVLARDVQLHPVSDLVEHIDFLRVTDNTKIAVYVPVHMINHDDSPGIDAKGVLNITRFEVEVLCIAKQIPDHIDVNLAGKDIGDAVKASDAILPEGASFVIERDFTIATISAPKAVVEEETAPAEGEAPAEGAEGAEKPEAEKAEGGKE